MAEPVYIFLHLPKTAGTTFREILDREYEAEETYNFDGEEARAAEVLGRLPAERLARLRIIRGHLPFGVHSAIGRPCRYLTILRDPVERVISLYLHVKRNPHHYCHAELHKQRLSLREFVESGITSETDNAQTRMLAGAAQPAFGKCDAGLLESATANLENHFALVGLTEAFPQTLMAARRILHWRRLPLYSVRNVGWNRSSCEITDADRAFVHRFNDLDARLHDHARAELNRLCACHCPDWEDELSSFRFRNFWHQKAARVRKVVGRLLKLK